MKFLCNFYLGFSLNLSLHDSGWREPKKKSTNELIWYSLVDAFMVIAEFIPGFPKNRASASARVRGMANGHITQNASENVLAGRQKYLNLEQFISGGEASQEEYKINVVKSDIR
jgi:hypothetical protein